MHNHTGSGKAANNSVEMEYSKLRHMYGVAVLLTSLVGVGCKVHGALKERKHEDRGVASGHSCRMPVPVAAAVDTLLP